MFFTSDQSKSGWMTFYREHGEPKPVTTTTVNLLRAASEIVGGDMALAKCLGIREALLCKFMTDSRELPDVLLLRTVDIILADREARLPFPDQPAGQPSLEMPWETSLRDASPLPQNPGRGHGGNPPAGSA
jgi:hypothetical protein